LISQSRGLGDVYKRQPFVATWLGAVTHSNFSGIFYPIALSALTVIVGVLYLPETKGRALMD
jgi:hypothetical protein